MTPIGTKTAQSTSVIAMIGLVTSPIALIVASLVGSVISVALIASGRGSMKYALPFGTFLALGAAFAAVLGPGLLDWYLARF